MTRYVDRFHPAAMVSDFAGNAEILEAFRLINGVPGITEAVIRWYGPIRRTSGGFEKDAEYSGPTPIEIVKPLRSKDPQEQRMALHFLEYGRGSVTSDEKGKTSLGPVLDDKTKEIRAWGERTPWVLKFTDEWRCFCSAMLPFYKQMHFIETENAFRLTNVHGLPMSRPLRDRFGTVDRTPIEIPDDCDLADALLGSLAQNIYGAVRAQALFFLWLCTAAVGDAAITEEDDQADPDPSDQRNELFRFSANSYQGARAWRPRDNLVELMVRSLYREPPSRLLAFMIAVKNVMAALITADPTFVLRNSTRDTLSSFVLGRAWMVPVADTLRGTAAFAVSSEDARQWFLQGGASSTLLETATDDPEHAEPLLPSLAGTSRLKRFTRSCRKAYNLVTAPARALEAGTRIMQFRRMLNRGATPRQAALASRAVATDFANRGAADDAITFVIRTTVFLNAAIQGLNETRKVALTRSGMGGKTRFWGEKAPKFWVAGIIGLTALSAFAWHHSTSTDENLEKYEALTTYHKSAYLHFTGVESAQGHFRIPVPFEVGFFFQKVPEMIFDAVADIDTSDTDPITRGILPPTAREILQTSFLLSSLPVPSAVAPAFDHVRNRNFFGAEIVPYYMMGRPPAARHFRSTPSTYVRAGEWLNVSPLVVKHYVETYGGNVARNAMVAAEWLTWDELTNGPMAFPSGALRATGLGAFATAPFPARSRWAENYYDMAEEVGHKCYMARRFEGSRQEEFIAENKSILRLCPWKTEVDRLLRPFGQVVRSQGFMISDVSREEKERRITHAYEWREQLFRRAYLMARDHLQSQD